MNSATAEVVRLPPCEADAKVERCLMAVAAFNGNSRKAAAFLSEDGIRVDHSTLYRWKRGKYRERYEEIRAEMLPQIRAKAADEHMDLAEQQMEVNRMIIARLKGHVDDIPARDLPGAARNMAVGAGIETEKAQLLNDQPTTRVAHNLPGVLKELKEMGIEFGVEAVVEDAEVVSEEEDVEDQPALPDGAGSS